LKIHTQSVCDSLWFDTWSSKCT